jgi:hypothetical protein
MMLLTSVVQTKALAGTEINAGVAPFCTGPAPKLGLFFQHH